MYLTIFHTIFPLGKPVLVKNSTDETDSAGPSQTADYSDDEIEVLSEYTENTDNETESKQEKTPTPIQTNTEVNSEMFVSAVQTQADEELVVLSTNDKAVF
jgi:co-chaperonin GroES (HSP10)